MRYNMLHSFTLLYMLMLEGLYGGEHTRLGRLRGRQKTLDYAGLCAELS